MNTNAETSTQCAVRRNTEWVMFTDSDRGAVFYLVHDKRWQNNGHSFIDFSEKGPQAVYIVHSTRTFSG